MTGEIEVEASFDLASDWTFASVGAVGNFAVVETGSVGVAADEDVETDPAVVASSFHPFVAVASRPFPLNFVADVVQDCFRHTRSYYL